MIRLNDRYTIDADRYCYTLYFDEGKTRTDKHGKEKKKREALGYYGTLDKAILGAFQFEAREIVGEGEKTLSQALTELKRAFRELEEQIKIAVPNVKVEITGGAE